MPFLYVYLNQGTLIIRLLRGPAATGVCLNGLRCRFKHNPEQVAICPKFLSDECNLPEGTCPLSHDPTPERVPVCVHFANGARCRNGTSCKYPHVRLGRKEGICRDFAVLGYCAKGLDCEHQHVRECPDFAETGACPTKGCRLPHVIRAQHKKVEAPPTKTAVTVDDAQQPTPASISSGNNNEEFISLTFEESSDEAELEDEEDSDGTEDEEDEEMADGEDENENEET